MPYHAFEFWRKAGVKPILCTQKIKRFQGFAASLSTCCPRAPRYRNVCNFRFLSYFECYVVEAPISWKVHASPHFRNSGQFSLAIIMLAQPISGIILSRLFSTHTVDNNVIKGLGYSQNRRVSGHWLCLLILQISIFVDRDVLAFSKAGTFFLLRYLKNGREMSVV